MLQLDNQTPFEAQLLPANDKDWKPIVVAIVKGAYDIGPGLLPKVSSKQLPIAMADKHWGEPDKTSVVYESDLALYKPATDLVLVGSAHAPGTAPVPQLDVEFGVGAVSKRISVLGDRKWLNRVLSFKASAPEPFRVLPLRYERAFGGVDQTHKSADKHGWEERNPVGTGYRVNSSLEAVENHPLPNLESPDALIKGWKDKPAPQGFGFIGRHWAPRRAYAGTYDENWQNNRAPVLPEDFDYRYFQAAHPDLVVSPHLHGNEHVRATNVCPAGPLDFDLPGHEVLAVAHFAEGERRVDGLLDTVVVMSDEGKLILVWRCHFECPRGYLALSAVQVLPKGKTPSRERNGPPRG